MAEHPTTGIAEIDVLLADCLARAREAFGVRLASMYLIGSLAHGGFAPAVSDIDVALLLAGPLEQDDARQIAALTAALVASHLDYGPRPSVFWSAPEEFASADRVQVAGRFPALDRCDLTAHGSLYWGADIRPTLAPPTRRAILANCRADLPRFVRDPAFFPLLTGAARADFSDRKALTRYCLFPARFLYTAATDEIASNDRAAEYYLAHYGGGPGDAIVALGLALRQDNARWLTAAEQETLLAELPGYYRQFLRAVLPLLDVQCPPPEATIAELLAALTPGTRSGANAFEEERHA
jgi:predicted nucleotidyltransferase